MAKDIFDAVYGCLVAGAIGDALGAHVEGWYWTEIRGQQEASGGSYSSHPRICETTDSHHVSRILAQIIGG
jgi:ADP-ribosylglycohydrolase